MKSWLVAVALLAACRASHRREDADSSHGSASVISVKHVVPKLPISDDGVAAIRALDPQIEKAAQRPHVLIGLLLERASVRGQLEDYQRALAESEAAVKAAPRDPAAWKGRMDALAAVHRFADARGALASYGTLADHSFLVGPTAMLDDATGAYAPALAARKQLVIDDPNPESITLYALMLAEGGRYDDALALLPKATTAVRWNTPFFMNWLLFQWGRIYEQKGDLVTARDFYEEAYRRLPSVETVEHLVGTLAATGDLARAKQIVDAAAKESSHPGLRALAVKLGVSKETAADVAAEWERYVTALPEAFSDHAARFYLDVGANPKRALELARRNLANRPTLEARTLVVDAALAAGDSAAACAEVDPLVVSPTRAAKFTAWKAVSACGRTEDAQRLAKDLGI